SLAPNGLSTSFRDWMIKALFLCRSRKSDNSCSRDTYSTEATSGNKSNDSLTATTSLSRASVLNDTLISTFSWILDKVASKKALPSIIEPKTNKVTVRVKTEAKVTTPFLQKLVKPARKILFKLV